MSQKFSYDNAILQLEEIITRMQSGEISLDQLSHQVKEAKSLFIKCQQKLRSIEEEIDAMDAEDDIEEKV